MPENIGVRGTAEQFGSLQLLRELQQALYEIARQAELGSVARLPDIEKRASQSLVLIDSYMLASQVEIGQLSLAFSPYGVGSILHEASFDLRPFTGTVGVEVHANQPVMTHAATLRSLLYSCGLFVQEVARSPLLLQSYLTDNGKIGVGVFAKDFAITPKELRKAKTAQGRMHMPMAQHSPRSGVLLQLADSLARCLNTELKVKKLGNQKGFAIVLPKSQQLSLVEG